MAYGACRLGRRCGTGDRVRRRDRLRRAVGHRRVLADERWRQVVASDKRIRLGGAVCGGSEAHRASSRPEGRGRAVRRRRRTDHGVDGRLQPAALEPVERLVAPGDSRRRPKLAKGGVAQGHRGCGERHCGGDVGPGGLDHPRGVGDLPEHRRRPHMAGGGPAYRAPTDAAPRAESRQECSLRLPSHALPALPAVTAVLVAVMSANSPGSLRPAGQPGTLSIMDVLSVHEPCKTDRSGCALRQCERRSQRVSPSRNAPKDPKPADALTRRPRLPAKAPRGDRASPRRAFDAPRSPCCLESRRRKRCHAGQRRSR